MQIVVNMCHTLVHVVMHDSPTGEGNDSIKCQIQFDSIQPISTVAQPLGVLWVSRTPKIQVGCPTRRKFQTTL